MNSFKKRYSQYSQFNIIFSHDYFGKVWDNEEQKKEWEEKYNEAFRKLVQSCNIPPSYFEDNNEYMEYDKKNGITIFACDNLSQLIRNYSDYQKRRNVKAPQFNKVDDNENKKEDSF